MTDLWSFLRAVLAVCAIIAYVMPAVAHHAPTGHALLHAQEAQPCPGHDGNDGKQTGMTHGAGDTQSPVDTPGGPSKCPAHKEGSTSCCVAMCHAALPMTGCEAPWVPRLSTQTVGRIADFVGPTVISRLDRPPKRAVPAIG